MGKEQEPWTDAMILTPNETFLHGRVRMARQGIEINIFYKEDAQKKTGELIAVKDVLVPYKVKKQSKQ